MMSSLPSSPTSSFVATSSMQTVPPPDRHTALMKAFDEAMENTLRRFQEEIREADRQIKDCFKDCLIAISTARPLQPSANEKMTPSPTTTMPSSSLSSPRPTSSSVSMVGTVETHTGGSSLSSPTPPSRLTARTSSPDTVSTTVTPYPQPTMLMGGTTLPTTTPLSAQGAIVAHIAPRHPFR